MACAASLKDEVQAGFGVFSHPLMAEPLLRSLLYLADVAALTFTSLVILRRLRVSGSPELLLGIAVLNTSQVVLTIELLSLLRFIRPDAVSLTHFGVALIAGFYAVHHQVRIIPDLLSLRLTGLASAFDARLRVFGVMVVVAGLVQLLLGLALPPRNHDSLAYHLARVGYYLQQKSLDSFPAVDLRQTVFPANSEIVMLWQVLLLGTDRTAALVQWLCWASLIFAAYLLARQLHFSTNQSLFSALALAAFPELLLQSSSTQNDLFAAFFVVSAFALAARSVSAGGVSLPHLMLGASSMALAIGTKATVLFIIPGFSLFSLVLFWPLPKPARRKSLLTMTLCSAICFLLLGSYFYIQNLRLYGFPAGPLPLSRLVMVPNVEPSTVWSNAGRIWLQLSGPSGVFDPATAQRLSPAYIKATDWFFRTFSVQKHIPEADYPGARWSAVPPFAVHEDFAWFGPVFGWLGCPLLVILLVWPGRLDPRRRAIAFTALAWLAAFVVLFRWQVWHGRLAVVMATIAAPLLGALYPAVRSRLGNAWSMFLISACAVPLFTCSVFNQSKPLRQVPEMIRKERLAVLVGHRPKVYELIRLLDDLRLEGKRIGLVPTHSDELEYLFFGEKFERKIVPLRFESDKVDPAKTAGLDGLLFLGAQQRYLVIEADKQDPKLWATTDLGQMLARLRTDAEWETIFDVPEFGHLFLRPRVSFNRSALSRLPDWLPAGCGGWPDKWVPDHHCLRVKIDPTRPVLEFKGQVLRSSKPVRVAITVTEIKQFREIMEMGPGVSVYRLSLAPLIPQFSGRYLTIHFACDFSFNPKQLGIGRDTRNLSWRLFELRLTPLERLPDFVHKDKWWSDKWVERLFRLKVKVDKTRSLLQFDAEFPKSFGKLELISGDAIIRTWIPPRNQCRCYSVDLLQLFDSTPQSYVSLEFRADSELDPRKFGQSKDSRHLSWRLYSLQLR